MSGQYEYPDDPEVFARVLQHFRNTSTAHWDARVARYAREARTLSPAPAESPVASVFSKKQENTAIVPPKRPTKRARSASGK
jgi:hypothetical protein